MLYQISFEKNTVCQCRLIDAPSTEGDYWITIWHLSGSVAYPKSKYTPRNAWWRFYRDCRVFGDYSSRIFGEEVTPA